MSDIPVGLHPRSETPSKADDTSNFPTPWDPLDPLPEYTRTWGPSLRRPTKLPEDYDTRIDPAHIFVFSRHPVTGIEKESFVTPKPCDYCAKIRQVCSRTRPMCQRCATSSDPQKSCEVEAGWVRLPGPKCSKPKLRNHKSDKTAPKKSLIPRKRARAIAIAPQPDTDGNVVPSENSSASPSPATSGEQQKAVGKAPPNKRPRSIQAESVKDSGSPGVTPPRKQARAKDVEVERKRRVSQRGSAPKTRRSSRKFAVIKTEIPPGSWEARDGTIWRSIRPPPAPSASVAAPPSLKELLNVETKPEMREKPRIWASSKDEYLAVLPELVKAIDANGSGIFKEDMALEPPLMFLEGSAWPDDKWDPDGDLVVSIEREFLVPPGRGQNTDGVSIDYNDDDLRDMALLDEGSPLPLDSLPKEPDHTTDLSIACHPTEILKSRREYPSDLLSPRPSPMSIATLLQPVCPPSPSQTTPHLSPPKESASNLYLPSLTGMFAKQFMDPGSVNPFNAPHTPASKLVPYLHKQATPDRTSLRGAELGAVNIIRLREQDTVHSIGRLGPATFDKKPPYRRSPASADSSDDESMDDLFDNLPPRVVSTMEPNPGLSRSRSWSPADPPSSDAAASTMSIVPQHNGKEIGRLVSHLPPSNAVRREVEQEMRSAAARASQLDRPRVQTTKWQREAVLPSELPPEIQRLQECQSYGIPVSIVMTKDSNLLPFSLPDEFGVVYLGFFKIQESSHNILLSQIDTDGQLTARVRWQYRLQWVPGGETMVPGKEQPNHPWWSTEHVMEEPSPYSLLPMHLSSEFVKIAGHHGTIASEVNTRLGWHCANCGRLNVQKQLCFQTCATCGTGNGMTAVGAMYIRDPHRMTPDSRPVDTYPDGVLCTTTDSETSSMKTFTYSIRPHVFVKHIFTCNRSHAQRDANHFFVDLQMQIPLTWQNAQTALASGPYYTYLAGFGHEDGASAVSWAKVPECVTNVRNLMQSLVVKEGHEEEFRVDQMTILAWHAMGNRKGAILHAKETTVALLCLGADIELNITPRGGYDEWAKDTSANHPSLVCEMDDSRMDTTIDYLEPVDLMDLEADAELNGPSVHTSAASISTSRGKSSKKRTEAMFITLVHGDMLIMSGDEFEYSLHRTGMGILVIGLPSDLAS